MDARNMYTSCPRSSTADDTSLTAARAYVGLPALPSSSPPSPPLIIILNTVQNHLARYSDEDPRERPVRGSVIPVIEAIFLPRTGQPFTSLPTSGLYLFTTYQPARRYSYPRY